MVTVVWPLCSHFLLIWIVDVPEFLTSVDSPQVDGTEPSPSATAGPLITPPLYATPPVSGSGVYGTAGAYGTTGAYGTAGAYGTTGAYGTAGAYGTTGSYGTAGAYGTTGSYGTTPIRNGANTTPPVSRTEDRGEAYATPPVSRAEGRTSAGGGISFNDRFRPSGENAGAESMYSLAHSVDAEVQRQLSGEQEIPAGIPLSEALASKGISSGNRTSSISLASGGDATASFNPDSPSFLSPHHETAKDGQNLYSPVPKKPSNTLGGSGSGGQTRPVPKPRSATLNPTTPRTVEQLGSPAQQRLTSSTAGSDSMTLGSHPAQLRAEVGVDGYLLPQESHQPGQSKKAAANYDRLPPGPPRPAVRVNAQASPRQHRSALLNPAAPPKSTEHSHDTAVQNTANHNPVNPTYINVKPVADEVPPVVDRKIKPAAPSPPRVDRKLKPRSSGEDTPNSTRSSSFSSGDSPPTFPVRTCSLANSLSDSQQPQATTEEPPPDFPVRTTSLEVSASAAPTGQKEDEGMDLPKPSTRTMQYTQIAFSPNSGNPVLLGDGENSGDSPARNHPVPAPRRGIGRVNYSDVDIQASGKLSEAAIAAREGQKEIKVSLNEAEIQTLKDKPYVNVDRKGGVDEESDPGYYMHMRVSRL